MPTSARGVWTPAGARGSLLASMREIQVLAKSVICATRRLTANRVVTGRLEKSGETREDSTAVYRSSVMCAKAHSSVVVFVVLVCALSSRLCELQRGLCCTSSELEGAGCIGCTQSVPVSLAILSPSRRYDTPDSRSYRERVNK